MKKLFGGIWEFFKKLSPLFSSLAVSVGNVLGDIGTALTDAFGNADFDRLFDIFNSGMLGAIAIGIQKFISSISGITDNVGGFLDNISGVLEDVRGCLEGYQENIKAKTLMTIATAVGILTASIITLSMIDSQKLSEVLFVMAGEFAELLGSMKILTSIIDGAELQSLSQMGSVMTSMAIALLILSAACGKLAALEWEELVKGLGGVAALSADLIISAKQFSECSGDMSKGAVGMIAFAAALRMLVTPVKELGELDLASLGKGLFGVGVLCTELALFLNNTDFDGMGIAKGIGIMALAGAVKIFASAVGEFAAMDTLCMIQGLAATAALLGELAAFTKLTGDSKNVIATSAGLVILGAAMHIFAGAIEKMGSLSIETLVKGLAAMAVTLAEGAAALIGSGIMKTEICTHIQLFLPRFFQIAIPAQHLQILGNGFTACVPRFNVISVHLSKFIVLVADRTDAILTLICFTLLSVRECSYAQVSFVTVKDIGVYTFLVANIIVSHKSCDCGFQSIGIKLSIFVCIIEQSPFYAFHFPTVYGEYRFYPLNHTFKIYPYLIGILIVLMECHIFFYCIKTVTSSNPPDSCFEILLPDR